TTLSYSVMKPAFSPWHDRGKVDLAGARGKRAGLPVRGPRCDAVPNYRWRRLVVEGVMKRAPGRRSGLLMVAGRCLPCHRCRGAWDSRGERPPEGPRSVGAR